MRHVTTSRSGALAATAIALVLAACGGSDGIAEVTSTAVLASTTAAPTTTVAPTTTGAPTTTVPPATTTPATTAAPTTTIDLAASLVLRPTGVGPLEFGTPAADTLATLTAALGLPTRDESASYPVPTAEGRFSDDTGEIQFAYPARRTTCFAGGLCTHFGGPDAASLAFVGWDAIDTLDATAGPRLATVDGIRVGSLWADHLDAMTVGEGGCYEYGYGDTDGILLSLHSTGEWFMLVDDAGNTTTGHPAPADVVVVSLGIGEREVFLTDDC